MENPSPFRYNSTSDYHPFGMGMPNRTWSLGSVYLYGFNGAVKDNETYNSGNEYDLGARIYDPRLGKFISIDPRSKRYDWQTPYAYFSNNPISVLEN